MTIKRETILDNSCFVCPEDVFNGWLIMMGSLGIEADITCTTIEEALSLIKARREHNNPSIRLELGWACMNGYQEGYYYKRETVES